MDWCRNLGSTVMGVATMPTNASGCSANLSVLPSRVPRTIGEIRPTLRLEPDTRPTSPNSPLSVVDVAVAIKLVPPTPNDPNEGLGGACRTRPLLLLVEAMFDAFVDCCARDEIMEDAFKLPETEPPSPLPVIPNNGWRGPSILTSTCIFGAALEAFVLDAMPGVVLEG